MVEGLYFHIPFCSNKCPYCDFVSFVSAPSEEYLDLLKREIELYSDLEFDLRTIYFGGGTPSLVPVQLWKRFFKLLNLEGVQEITIECNPENYRREDFEELLSLGVNRLSFGVQSFSERNLRFLGRWHSSVDSIRAVHQAHLAGFENISIDLIYGLPGQGLRELKEELKVVKDLPITHLSAYLLTPYEDTLFGKLWQQGELKLPSDQEIEEMFLFLSDELSSMGFIHYEISNFAKEGFECKHNLIYWTHREFLGLGVSAWSFVNRRRFGNYKNLELYKNSLLKGVKPVDKEEVLEGEELLKDYFFVALRTRYGVPRSFLNSVPEELREFFFEDEHSIRLTKRGWLLINEVLIKLI
ncbi:radical SAM family heme chaperone HemW [Thermocrinis sp.]